MAMEPTQYINEAVTNPAEKPVDLFENLAGQGKTVLIVTHDRAITKRTDETVLLSDGEVMERRVSS